MDFFSRSRRIIYSPQPLTSFHATRSEALINPHGHSIVEDCLIARVKGDTLVQGSSSPGAKIPLYQLSDEELLARFTRGLFGGIVFAAERFILASGGWRLMAVQIKGQPSARSASHSAKVILTSLCRPNSTESVDVRYTTRESWCTAAKEHMEGR